MPGAIFQGMPLSPASSDTIASSPRAAGGPSGGSSTSFLLWLVLLGVIVPVLILGGLKLGGFSFVFRNR